MELWYDHNSSSLNNFKELYFSSWYLCPERQDCSASSGEASCFSNRRSDRKATEDVSFCPGGDLRETSDLKLAARAGIATPSSKWGLEQEKGKTLWRYCDSNQHGLLQPHWLLPSSNRTSHLTELFRSHINASNNRIRMQAGHMHVMQFLLTDLKLSHKGEKKSVMTSHSWHPRRERATWNVEKSRP